MPDDVGNKPDENPKNPEIEETRTSIDTLLELLKVKGKSELNSVAVELNIDPRIIENWAKVLENGNLIRISYKVGKMYLEPVSMQPEQQQDLKTKNDVTKFILEEDIAIEKISLEKFSKNIEELNKSIGNMSKIYKAKLPDIERMLDSVDKAYAPLDAKKKSMDKLKDEADKDFDEITRKADALYVKLGAFSPKQMESEASERTTKLNNILQSIDDAQRAMKDTETSANKFFITMQTDLDSQVKELKKVIFNTKASTDQTLRTNSRQLAELIKTVRDQVFSAQRASKEVDGYKREFESARRDLDVLKADFSDRYAKIKQSMERDIQMVEEDSKHINEAVKSLKESFGDISKYDDEIRRWRTSMNDMSREIATTRTEIIKLSTQLNSIETNKDMNVEAKSKSINEISKQSKKTKDKTTKIKKVIKDTADEIKGRIEENK
jgi:chromosome segregation ATPase